MRPQRHPFGARRARTSQAARLAEIDRDFAAHLQQQLEIAGEARLATAVRELRVVERCHCDSPSCASFYAVERSQAGWLWARGRRTIQLGGGVAVDAVGDRIVAVEVLGRASLRNALALRWPDRPAS